MKGLKLFITVLLSAAVIGGLTLAIQGNTVQAKEAKTIKVAFIYPGPRNDGGWSEAHDKGRQYLQKTLPYVKTSYSENVKEGAPAEKVIRAYVNQGYKVIFATSFGYMDPMYNVAKDYPNVVFEHCSGFKMRKNMGNYFGRMYQPDYLAGLIAGFMTKTNYIGFVAPFSIPEVVREIDAFTIGVREVNPKAEVHVIWTNSWFDPVKESNAAQTFLNNGADVIASGVDSPAPINAAAKKGKYAIGYDSDMAHFAPKAVLCSRVWDWGPFYVKTVKAVANGTWKAEAYWGGMETGLVKLSPFGPMVPEKVKKYVEAKKKLIIAHKFDPFQGPIYDQKGNLKVKKGQTLSDKDKLSLQWFVKGVVGSIPKSGS